MHVSHLEACAALTHVCLSSTDMFRTVSSAPMFYACINYTIAIVLFVLLLQQCSANTLPFFLPSQRLAYCKCHLSKSYNFHSYSHINLLLFLLLLLLPSSLPPPGGRHSRRPLLLAPTKGLHSCFELFDVVFPHTFLDLVDKKAPRLSTDMRPREMRESNSPCHPLHGDR